MSRNRFPTPEIRQANLSSHPGFPLALRREMARELDRLREDMENLGVQLCLDEEVMVRCMPHLQRLDEMGQRSLWLAALLRADDPLKIISEITLQSLADRLDHLREGD